MGWVMDVIWFIFNVIDEEIEVERICKRIYSELVVGLVLKFKFLVLGVIWGSFWG